MCPPLRKILFPNDAYRMEYPVCEGKRGTDRVRGVRRIRVVDFSGEPVENGLGGPEDERERPPSLPRRPSFRRGRTSSGSRGEGVKPCPRRCGGYGVAGSARCTSRNGFASDCGNSTPSIPATVDIGRRTRIWWFGMPSARSRACWAEIRTAVIFHHAFERSKL